MTDHNRRDPAIEEFLASVGTKLKRMPPARRAEELDELGQHLDLLVAGYRAQGRDQRSAVTAAIERFGHAEHIGRQLWSASRRSSRRTPLYYLAFWLGYGAIVLIANLALLAVIDAPPALSGQLGDHLRTAWIPAVVLPAVFVLHDLWRHRNTAKTGS
ncbi:hypothetical protein HS041_27165 [Planomonospora sp. ID67723]|uniref:hypothetical protein n=1 Tax=Planomonospora sp. ID67723 TaxID=2738134 RepID=UPI0018C365F0|nr:hypothetical protein [Planomonospora sp. ID67723]MBG0831431.1 hypothetical protein [Planomonospora sp. ID67723]